jgi:predicted membrane chloride channel (bestrophin family)
MRTSHSSPAAHLSYPSRTHKIYQAHKESRTTYTAAVLHTGNRIEHSETVVMLDKGPVLSTSDSSRRTSYTAMNRESSVSRQSITFHLTVYILFGLASPSTAFSRSPSSPARGLHLSYTAVSSSSRRQYWALFSQETTTSTSYVGDLPGDDTANVPAALYNTDPNDHRYSALDWWHNIRSLSRSSILRAIQGPILAVVVWSAAVSLVHRILLMSGWDALAGSMCISSSPHSLVVSALGLLLVFRTNSAYQKFAEGRIIWERILSVSRNMSRMTMLYEKQIGAARRRRIFRLLATFPYLLHHHIQPQCLPKSDLEKSEYGLALRRTEPESITADRFGSRSRERLASTGTSSSTTTDSLCWVDKRSLPWCLFPEGALHLCANSPNRPLWVCDRLSQEVVAVEYTSTFTSRERSTLLGHIDKLSQCIGECERIHQTAVPLNYARHSLRSLTLWLFTLPFALIKDFGLMTGPVMAATSWLLYGIYQIGYSIEDPFQGSLRLSTLCDTIYRDCMYGTDFMRRRATAFWVDEEAHEWNKLDSQPCPVNARVADPRP